MSFIHSIKAYEKSVNPSLQISLIINYNETKIPLSLEGELLSLDNKLLSNFYTTASMPAQTQDINLSANNVQQNNNQSYNSDVIVHLSRESLDYIEKMREQNANKDVKLRINFKIKYLISNVLISHLNLIIDKPQKESGGIKQYLVVYDYGGNSPFYLNVGDMNILSGDSGKSFLKLKTDNFYEGCTITASDWINNYAPKLGLGRYIILEIPEPNIIEEEKFKELLDIKDKVKSHLDQGNWNDTISNSRRIFELLGKEEGLKKILGDSFVNQCFSDEAIDDFFRGINGLFNFASKFDHSTDRRGNFQKCPIANKEDAYMAYSIISNLLNVVSKKSS